jgi:Right handed beta helix region
MAIGRRVAGMLREVREVMRGGGVGHQNNSIPAVFFEGGSNNQFLNNTITAGPQGGAALQLQALADTPNSDFVVSQNTFDSSNLLLIGLNNSKVTNNNFSNRTLANTIAILVCGPWTGTSQNITIDGNTLDASIGQNGAIISGLPNDPGGMSNIDGFSITNNILKGTGSGIAVQSFDQSNFTDNTLIGNNKTNVTITGNQLSSLWTGSTINIRGGAGSVDTVLVQSNTLQNSAGAQNVITQDNHTYNVTIRNNSL